MKTNIHFRSHLAQFFLEREMFQTNVVEKIKTHVLSSVNVFLKSRRLRDNVGNLLQQYRPPIYIFERISLNST
jgi:hypothetical protein